MEWLYETYYGNTTLNWLSALGTLLGTGLALKVLRGVLTRRVGHWAGKSEHRLLDVLDDLVEATHLLAILAVAVWAGSQWLDLPRVAHKAVRALAVVAFFLQVARWGAVFVDYFAAVQLKKREAEEDKAADMVVTATSWVAKVALWSVMLLLALDNLGFNVSALVAGMGVGGIAIALAVQNILGDIFCAVSIVLDKPFEVGDFIIVGSEMGTVERVGIKTTRVRSLSGEQIVFSNADLVGSRVRNFGRMEERRAVFTFGILYETPVEKVEKVAGMVREIIESHENTRFDRAHFKAFGESSLDFEVVFFVLVPEYPVYMDIQQAINLELMRRCQAEGIDFAYPTRTVYFQQKEPEPEAS